jgi:hypothetical protein
MLKYVAVWCGDVKRIKGKATKNPKGLKVHSNVLLEAISKPL